MKKRRQKGLPKPPNVAARALGSKIFGLKVVTPKKGYSRKLKHEGGVTDPADTANSALEADE